MPLAVEDDIRLADVSLGRAPHSSTRTLHLCIHSFIHSFMTTTPTATTLSAYGEELIAACRAYSDAALAVKDDDKDDGARTEPPTAGVASTRGCIDACARIDAEGTKGTRERNPHELTSRTVD